MVDDISHEGLRALLREEGVSFQVIKTWKQSNDPDFEVKKNRVLELYDIADGKAKPKRGDPDGRDLLSTSSGPSTSSPSPGTQWAPSATRRASHRPGPAPADAGPPTPARTASVTCMAAYDLTTDKLYGHIEDQEGTAPTFLDFCRYIRTPAPARRPHRHRARQLQPAPVDEERHAGRRLGRRPTTSSWPTSRTNASWLNRIEAQFTGAALLHPGRHRPPLTRGAGLDDPPLHRLAEPQRSRQNPP